VKKFSIALFMDGTAMLAMPAKLSKQPSIRRLPAYLGLLRQLHDRGCDTVSGVYLAERLGLDKVQVRKDLTITGVMGKPRVGFSVPVLIHAIECFLGWDQALEALLVGAGNLGTALLGYTEFPRHGLRIVAAFDSDPTRAGREIYGTPVFAMGRIAEVNARLRVPVAILTVPADVAQRVTDQLVGAGVTALWNFTPVTLDVPAHVVVQNESLVAGLAVLTKKLCLDECRLPHND
jgi:redox-sensing transcriptional repressor